MSISKRGRGKTAAARKTAGQMSENIKKETNYTVNESIKLCFHFGSLLFKDEKSADNKAVTFYFGANFK